jgi:hypothetical protein
LAGSEKVAHTGGRKTKGREAMPATFSGCTTQKKLSNATHARTRSLAETLRTSRSMVNRGWRDNRRKPHMGRTFKVGNEPRFIDKVPDVGGVHRNPPEHARVPCGDQKTQTQPRDRTQHTLPMKLGRCGTITHVDVHNGTITLFAALNVAEGKLIGSCRERHRQQEWSKGLKQIDVKMPAELELRSICDNDATQKLPRVQSWLKRHGRFHMHFIPTSRSWLNLVEPWFGESTDMRIRRGVFRS